MNSFSERKKIREEAERETFSVDPAKRCICPICSDVHWVKKSGKGGAEPKAFSRTETAAEAADSEVE